MKNLDDCVVAVSYIVTALGDVASTPMGTNQPGVVSHLQALNDLIQNSFLERTSRFTDASLLLAILPFVFFSNRCPGIASLLILWVGGLMLIFGLDAWLVFARNTVFSAIYVAGLWTATNVAEVARRYVREFVERLKLSTTMSFYFSPRVLEKVLKDPGSTEAQEAELTVLLTDLRNSTPLAERLGAKEFFLLLNQVFEIQTLAVMAEEGNLEHFLGDQFLSVLYVNNQLVIDDFSPAAAPDTPISVNPPVVRPVKELKGFTKVYLGDALVLRFAFAQSHVGEWRIREQAVWNQPIARAARKALYLACSNFRCETVRCHGRAKGITRVPLRN
jgi:class 3 adenylate cyclase